MNAEVRPLATEVARQKSYKNLIKIMKNTTCEGHYGSFVHIRIEMLKKSPSIFKCSKCMLNDNPARIHDSSIFFVIESKVRDISLQKLQQI